MNHNAIDRLEKSYIPFQCMVINHVNKFRVEGIPTAQYFILETLAAEGGKTTKGLAEQRGISPSGISKLTKVLLEKGYIQQERSTEDRRYYTITITDAGRAFLERSEKFRNEILNRIGKALSEKEKEQFSILCDKIVGFMD